MAEVDAGSIFSFPTVTPPDSPTPDVDPIVDNEVDPVEDTEEGVEADPTEDESGGEADETEEGAEKGKEKGTDKAPTKLTPAAIRNTLKALKEANPEAVKAIQAANDALGRAEAIEKLFPKRVVDGKTVGGVSEAQAYKSTVDSLGGLEGVTKMQGIAQSVEQTDALLAEGNPEVLKQLIADAPDGLLKLTPHYLKEVYGLAQAKARAGDTTALDAIEAAIQPHGLQQLLGAGFERALTALDQATTIEDVKKVVTNMKQWLAGEKQKAEGAGTSKVDPREEAFTKKEQEFNQKQDTAFRTEIGTAIISHTNKELGTRIGPYLKNYPNLTANQKADIANSLYREMDKEIKADKTGTLSMNALLKKRDKAGAITHGSQAVSAAADRVVDKVMKAYGLKATVKGKKTDAGDKGAGKPADKSTVNSGGAKPIRVTAKPDRNLWDVNKTTEDMIVRGEAILKNGKWVKWR